MKKIYKDFFFAVLLLSSSIESQILGCRDPLAKSPDL